MIGFAAACAELVPAKLVGAAWPGGLCGAGVESIGKVVAVIATSATAIANESKTVRVFMGATELLQRTGQEGTLPLVEWHEVSM